MTTRVILLPKPVPTYNTVADLPPSASPGDILTLVNGDIYTYNGTTWILQSSGGGAIGSFSTIHTPNGTSPVATSPTDILTLTSSDGTLNITGNSSTDTVNLVVDPTIMILNAIVFG